MNNIFNAYKEKLWKTPEALNYLIKERGFTKNTIEKFNLGYSEDMFLKSVLSKDDFEIAKKNNLVLEDGSEYYSGYIVFPVYENDKVVFSYGRLVGNDGSKHKVQKGSKKVPFNLKALKSASVVLVESPIDAMTMEQMGFYSVALYSSNIASGMENYFKGKNCYILFDKDDAGKIGSERTATKLSPVANNIYIVSFPANLKEKIDVNNYYMRVGSARERLSFLLKNATRFEKPKFPLRLKKIKKIRKEADAEDAIPIVEVGKRLFEHYHDSGNAIWVRCPHHKGGREVKPSLWIGGNKNIFNCYGCGVGGGPIMLVKWHLGLTFREAKDWLRENFGGQ